MKMVYNKEYYEANKERINQRRRELWAKRDNSQRIQQINEYHKTEKGKEAVEKYRNSEKCKKSTLIASWKFRGIIHSNFDELYENYIKQTVCESCNVVFNEDRKLNCWKCLDHDHSTGQFRKIVCNKCNSRDAYLKNN